MIGNSAMMQSNAESENLIIKFPCHEEGPHFWGCGGHPPPVSDRRSLFDCTTKMKRPTKMAGPISTIADQDHSIIGNSLSKLALASP